jgi:hypothetical protein
MWGASELTNWEGAPVRVPAPVDALLVGLVLQRLWNDHGYLKPHDAIDFRLLIARVSRDELRDRARALRCTRTLAHFLDRCDPERGRLRLVPTRSDRIRLGLVAWREWSLVRRRMRFHRAPGVLVDVLGVLPEILAARRQLRAERDLRRLLDRATPNVPAMRSSLERRFRTVRAMRWATRLFRLNPKGDCALRSVAIYTALARQGWPVTFVSGVRRGERGVEGHAWVECDGRELPELREPTVRLAYRETFRWPPSSAEGG